MPMLETIAPYKGYVIFAVLAVLFVLERLYPVARMIGGLQRLGRNASVASINIVMSPFIVIPLTAYLASIGPQWRPESWSNNWVLIIDLLILDCWIYWWHRVNHVVPFLWRFHEVHHLDETLDTTSALRFHFGEVLLSAVVRSLVIILLNVPLVTVVIFEMLVAVAAIFHHSNIKLPQQLERVLSKIIVTPSIHWVHHHAIRKDTDSNYATFLSVWDRLFGSGSNTVRTPEMKIGVEKRPEKDLLGLLLRPFK